MIVTRKRRKPFPFKRLLLPAIAIALVVFAVLWGPSRNVIANGPLAPAYRAGSDWFNVVATPFHFAAQNQVITDRGRQIVQLQTQLTAAQSAAADKDKKIGQLQKQLEQSQNQLSNANQSVGATSTAKPGAVAPKPSSNAATLAFGSTQGSGTQSIGSDLSAGATPDMKRTAQYWASMDPENAAKVAQRLPVPYVARILSLMQPDTVGAILDAMPPNVAAKLTQENPSLQH